MKHLFAPLFLLALAIPAMVRSADPIPDDHKINGFAIGCQAYTFSKTALEASGARPRGRSNQGPL